MFSLFSLGRPGGRPTFHLGSIPVKVEFSFWLIAVLLGMQISDTTALVIWVAVLFASILIHELGHALAYLARGAQAQILLYGGGGLTFGRRDAPFRIGERIVTSLAGPFAGMLLGGVVYLVSRAYPPSTPHASYAVTNLLWVNLGWGLFNLLPVLPLDGGHVLESLLQLKDEAMGRVWARYASIAVSGALIFACLFVMPELMPGYSWSWPALMLGLFAMQSFQTLAVVDPRRQRELQRAIAVEAPPPEAPDVIENLGRLHKLLAEEQPEQARAVAHQVLAAAKGYGARDQALRALAWLSIGAGKPQEAIDYLAKTSPRFDDPLTWGTAIAASGDAANALPHLARAFERSADPQTVATYARCLVAVGQAAEARKLLKPDAPVEPQRALAEALFRSRDFSGSAEVSRRLFERTADPHDAYNLACAESRLGRTEDAMRWLRTAVDKGFVDRAHLEEDPDLAPLRERAEWSELLSRLTTPAV